MLPQANIWKAAKEKDTRIAELEASNSEMKEKLENPVCHRGHNDYPLTLWDCPTCVEKEKKTLEMKIRWLRKLAEYWESEYNCAKIRLDELEAEIKRLREGIKIEAM